MTEPGGELLNRARILEYLQEVAAELPGGERRTIVLVGGSFLALNEKRKATLDVDSVTGLDAQLRTVAAEVGARHGLRRTWLNDHAMPFRPAGLRDEMCVAVLDSPTLQVLQPPARYVFAMKLSSNRVVDTQDLRPLWELADFSSVEEALTFTAACYPDWEADPHLADFLREHVVPVPERARGAARRPRERSSPPPAG